MWHVSRASGKITKSQSHDLATYVSKGWDSNIWKDSELNTPVLSMKNLGNSLALRTDIIKKSPSVTLRRAKMSVQYVGSSWNMGNTWAIHETKTFPHLMERPMTPVPIPRSTAKIMSFVQEHNHGTVYFEGTIYRSLNKDIMYPRYYGATGEMVTHKYDGDELDLIGNPSTYLFFASAESNINYPGSFGPPTRDIQRTVTLKSDYQSDVVFYYRKELLAYDSLIKASTTEGVIQIVVFAPNVSKLKIVMPDKTINHIGLVPLDDFDASPIRVYTPEGVLALQKLRDMFTEK